MTSPSILREWIVDRESKVMHWPTYVVRSFLIPLRHASDLTGSMSWRWGWRNNPLENEEVSGTYTVCLFVSIQHGWLLSVLPNSWFRTFKLGKHAEWLGFLTQTMLLGLRCRFMLMLWIIMVKKEGCDSLSCRLHWFLGLGVSVQTLGLGKRAVIVCPVDCFNSRG